MSDEEQVERDADARRMVESSLTLACPLPGDAGLKYQGDPFARDEWCSFVEARRLEMVRRFSSKAVTPENGLRTGDAVDFGETAA